jgi:DNA-binding NarL/FixJ family response regulator
MPEMSGIELIKAVTALCAKTVPIVLTGSAELQTAVAAINEANVFRFYTKPCPATVLGEGIALALLHGDGDGLKAAAGARPSTDAAFGVALLHRLPVGVVVVDHQSRVLFMNSRGAEYVAGNDGLCVGRSGICRATRPAETAELHGLVAAVVGGGEMAAVRAVALTRANKDRPLSVVVAPLIAAADSAPVAVLLVSDPERQSVPSVATVGKLFDLTEAEARLALALAAGQRIEEAAVSLGITLSSARTYLKHVFGKVGVSRQTELVRLVLAAPTLADLGTVGRTVHSR